jgi:hypothetical protein
MSNFFIHVVNTPATEVLNFLEVSNQLTEIVKFQIIQIQYLSLESCDLETIFQKRFKKLNEEKKIYFFLLKQDFGR